MVLFIYHRSQEEEQMKCTYTPSYCHESCGLISLLAIPSHRIFTDLKKIGNRDTTSGVIVA